MHPISRRCSYKSQSLFINLSELVYIRLQATEVDLILLPWLPLPLAKHLLSSYDDAFRLKTELFTSAYRT